MKSKCLCILTVSAILFMMFTMTLSAQTDPHYRLRYAQVANGLSGGWTYVTTVLITNVNSSSVEVQLEDFDHNNPMNALRTQYYHSCTVTSSTAFTINFLIPGYSSCKVWTDGVGPLETGWLRVTEIGLTRDIGGYAAWTLYMGNPATSVPFFSIGVSAIQICGQFSIPVVRDKNNGDDTGFSIVNPYNYTVYFRASLYNSSGTYVSYVDITLPAFAHLAMFFSELFPVSLGNANNFVGTMIIWGQSSSDGAIASTLLQVKGQYAGATSNILDVHSMKRSSDGLFDEIVPMRTDIPGRSKAIE